MSAPLLKIRHARSPKDILARYSGIEAVAKVGVSEDMFMMGMYLHVLYIVDVERGLALVDANWASKFDACRLKHPRESRR